MSQYSLDYLRDHTRIGDVAQNGLPWTARALGIENDESVYTADASQDGEQWLYPSAVPLSVARDLLDSFAVVSHPLSFIRPVMPWDDPEQVITIDGEQFTVVTDSTRQVIADAKNDRVHFVPKDGYKIHPFAETLIDRTARIVSESQGDLHIDSVGVLAHGGEAWVSISTKSLMTTPEGVSFYSHILSAGSHNGTLSTTNVAVNTDTVCDNTRAMALGEGKENGTMTKARHTRYSDNKLSEQESEARSAMGLIEIAQDNFMAEIAALSQTVVTDQQFSNWLTAELFPIPDDAKSNTVTRMDKARETVTALYKADPRCEPWHGTAWGALQAVNTFDLWERGTRGENSDHKTRAIREAITGKLAEREESRVDSLMRVLVDA
jgi:phage/plasmid-like protein (TIGR03299 family)